MDARKIDMVFFKCYEQGINVDFNTCETIAKENTAKDIYNAWKRVERMKRNGLL